MHSSRVGVVVFSIHSLLCSPTNYGFLRYVSLTVRMVNVITVHDSSTGLKGNPSTVMRILFRVVFAIFTFSSGGFYGAMDDKIGFDAMVWSSDIDEDPFVSLTGERFLAIFIMVGLINYSSITLKVLGTRPLI